MDPTIIRVVPARSPVPEDIPVQVGNVIRIAVSFVIIKTGGVL
jgi:hypothetical protein